MAASAFLEVDLYCVHCGSLLTDMVWFQWGYCRSRIPADISLYHLGDSIRWHACPDGAVLPWTQFDNGAKSFGSNVGDPSVTNLVVLDQAQFGPDRPNDRKVCGNCGAAIDGAAVEIRGGVVAKAWVWRAGDFDPRTTYYLLAEDGQRTPVPAWEDRAMDLLAPDCSPWPGGQHGADGL